MSTTSRSQQREEMIEKMRMDKETRLRARMEAEDLSPDNMRPLRSEEKEPMPRDLQSVYQSEGQNEYPPMYSEERSEDLRTTKSGNQQPEVLMDYRRLLDNETSARTDIYANQSTSGSKRYPQERFYDNARRREKHKQLFKKMIDEDIKSLANSKKINKKSEKILIRRLEENLSLAFNSVDPQEKKQISFEQLGRVLFLVEIFEVIKYDESCKVITEDFFSNERDDMMRRRSEMEFHEQLFNHLAYDGELIHNQVNIELAYSFLRILMDPRNLKPNKHLAIVKDLMTSLGMTVVEETKVVRDPTNDEELLIIPIWNLIKRFRNLKEANLYSSKIGYLKSQKINEYEEKMKSELTFNPKINPMSKILDKAYISKVQEELVQVGSIGQNTMRHQTSEQSNFKNNYPVDRVQMLYLDQELRNERLKEKTKMKEEKEIEGCTFAPNLGQTNGFNSKKRSKKRNPQEVVSQLYGSLKPKYETYQQIKNEIDVYKENEELEKCTFAPKINNYSTKRQRNQQKNLNENPPVGYNKAILRMRMAHEQKSRHRMELEHIPVGEGLERRRREKVHVPKCAKKRNFKRDKALIYLDINVAPGKTGRLGIYKNDDPCERAKSFAQAFQLNEEVEEGLSNLIQAYIDEKTAQEGSDYQYLEQIQIQRIDRLWSKLVRE